MNEIHKNETVSYDEWMKIISDIPSCMWVQRIGPIPQYDMYRGKCVIYGRHRILFFDHCEYCYSKELDKNNCCSKCGAPALHEDYGI